MPVPKIDIVKILLPIIVRLCPELKVAEVTRGKIIPLTNINPLNEEQEARNLARKFQRQPRRDGRKDSSEVINLDTAIKIVEKNAGDGGLVAKVVRRCVLALIAGGTGDSNVTEQLMNPIVTEMREKTLRQDTPRVNSDKKSYHRPARGHGHGRRHISGSN
jgi:L-asparaginase/Glu-tRNA(Gln) amidotransferase subunit D